MGLKKIVTKFDNDLLFFLNCNGCSISCVIKASAKSHMLLVHTSVNILHILLVFQSYYCCEYFMCCLASFFLINIKFFCNGAQEISIGDSPG